MEVHSALASLLLLRGDKQTPNKKPGGNSNGGRVHLLQSRPSFQGNQGRQPKPWSYSHLQSEAEGDECF